MSTKKNVSCEPLTNHNHWSHSHLRKQHRQWLERLPAVSTVISTPQYKVINGFGYLKEPSPTDRDFTISIVFNPLSMLRKYDPQQAKSLLTNPSHTWLPDFGFSENFKHLLYTSIQFAIFIKRTANAESQGEKEKGKKAKQPFTERKWVKTQGAWLQEETHDGWWGQVLHRQWFNEWTSSLIWSKLLLWFWGFPRQSSHRCPTPMIQKLVEKNTLLCF